MFTKFNLKFLKHQPSSRKSIIIFGRRKILKNFLKFFGNYCLSKNVIQLFKLLQSWKNWHQIFWITKTWTSLFWNFKVWKNAPQNFWIRFFQKQHFSKNSIPIFWNMKVSKNCSHFFGFLPFEKLWKTFLIFQESEFLWAHSFEKLCVIIFVILWIEKIQHPIFWKSRFMQKFQSIFEKATNQKNWSQF